MTALATDRNTPKRAGDQFSLPVAATEKIYAGSLVCLSATGYAVPGSTATTLTVVGRASAQVDNSAGDNADKSIDIERGVFRWANSAAADAITTAEIGDVCYIVDDQTVAKTSGTNTRSRAGFVVDVDDQGVWVLTGYGILSDPAGALLAANNLSDLAAAATARANLGGGADKIILGAQDISLVGASADVKRLVSPVAGVIASVRSVISGALAVGDATLTVAINGTAVTAGAITVAETGSAAGDVDAVTPSAANTVAAGDVITITAGGTNTADETAQVMLTITPSA